MHDVRPAEGPYHPASQAKQVAEAARAEVPAGQVVQSEGSEEPVAERAVPSGQPEHHPMLIDVEYSPGRQGEHVLGASMLSLQASQKRYFVPGKEPDSPSESVHAIDTWQKY
jgi:hypothetical protein